MADQEEISIQKEKEAIRTAFRNLFFTLRQELEPEVKTLNSYLYSKYVITGEVLAKADIDATLSAIRVRLNNETVTVSTFEEFVAAVAIFPSRAHLKDKLVCSVDEQLKGEAVYYTSALTSTSLTRTGASSITTGTSITVHGLVTASNYNLSSQTDASLPKNEPTNTTTSQPDSYHYGPSCEANSKEETNMKEDSAIDTEEEILGQLQVQATDHDGPGKANHVMVATSTGTIDTEQYTCTNETRKEELEDLVKRLTMLETHVSLEIGNFREEINCLRDKEREYKEEARKYREEYEKKKEETCRAEEKARQAEERAKEAEEAAKEAKKYQEMYEKEKERSRLAENEVKKYQEKAKKEAEEAKKYQEMYERGKEITREAKEKARQAEEQARHAEERVRQAEERTVEMQKIIDQYYHH